MERHGSKQPCLRQWWAPVGFSLGTVPARCPPLVSIRAGLSSGALCALVLGAFARRVGM